MLMRDHANRDEVHTEWIRAALACVHDMPRKVSNFVSGGRATPDRGGLSVTVNGRRQWIPPRSGSSEN